MNADRYSLDVPRPRCAANKSRRTCAQGHQPCPTPWTCGLYEFDSTPIPVAEPDERHDATDLGTQASIFGFFSRAGAAARRWLSS